MRRARQREERLETLQRAREAYGPVLFITPKGSREEAFSRLLRDYGETTNTWAISESEQLRMSAEVPDGWLRQWLDASAVLIKECQEAVDREHPMTGLNDPEEARNLLEAFQKEYTENFDMMAQRSILQALMTTMRNYNTSQDLLRQFSEDRPDRATEILENVFIREEETVQRISRNVPEDNAQLLQAKQRVSTLEDQLRAEREKREQLEEEKKNLRAQVKAHNEFLATGGAQFQENPEEAGETSHSREEAVLETIAQPGSFPHLRFLPAATKELGNYLRPRPRAQEIVGALDTINTLAELYLDSDNGNIGSWKDYFNMPGWTYANAESETTMGKHGTSRRFRDQDRDRYVVVQRHLTYRGSSAGMRIFFDADDQQGPFIIAYIGEHLPYASERS